MKRSVTIETEDTDISTKTESLLEHTPRRMSDLQNGTSTKVSATSEEVALQVKAVMDPLTQQLAHLCELMKELGNERGHRRHEKSC